MMDITDITCARIYDVLTISSSVVLSLNGETSKWKPFGLNCLDVNLAVSEAIHGNTMMWQLRKQCDCGPETVSVAVCLIVTLTQEKKKRSG